MLKKLLRAPESQHFDDRALTSDIMRFDEACYLSDWVQPPGRQQGNRL